MVVQTRLNIIRSLPLVLTDKVLTLSPEGISFVMSVCTHVSGKRKEVLCALKLSPHIVLYVCLVPCCGHSLFMQFLVSPYADILRTPGTCGWEPASTVHQTLGTSYR